MNKTVRKINKDQLAEMVANITKQVIKESFDFTPNGLNPEASEDEYSEAQDYFRDNPGMPMDEPNGENGDEEFYDDFLSNPAESSFPTEEPGDESGEDGIGADEIDLDSLLESKEAESLTERQDKLLNFITENWDNHANNLIK